MIYLAAPLFTPSERERNAELAGRLSALDALFLPQRDGLLLTELVRSGTPVAEAESLVFSQDIAAIRQSNLLVAVLDGAVVDEGVAFEIGFACALDICCIGLQTDCRRQLPTGNNPMISQGLHALFDNEDRLRQWCREHYQGLKLRSRHRGESGRKSAVAEFLGYPKS